jgi:nucleotide-binding universal stress UspA family protein
MDDLLNRILVPLDGSPHAEAVLSQLRRILTPHESRLILLQATPFAPWASDEHAEKYLCRVAFQLTNDGYPATPMIRRGSPAETILETAFTEHASLIALTTHGRSGPTRWVLGSVAERILQASPLPVLVARTLPTDVCRGKLESRPIRNFLVPLDGSPQSLGSLGPVLSLARPVDAQVTLLHVNEPFPYDTRWNSPDETLKAADQRLRAACVPSRVEQRQGDPADVILETAEKEEMDLIAMTTHGRSGPSRWLFGSVAAKVLRGASTPLLVVRHGVPANEEISPGAGPSAQGPGDGTALAQQRT